MITAQSLAKSFIKWGFTREQFVYVVPPGIRKIRSQWVSLGERGKSATVIVLTHSKEITREMVEDAVKLLPSFYDKDNAESRTDIDRLKSVLEEFLEVDVD